MNLARLKGWIADKPVMVAMAGTFGSVIVLTVMLVWIALA
jgi:hypothetical protein